MAEMKVKTLRRTRELRAGVFIWLIREGPDWRRGRMSDSHVPGAPEKGDGACEAGTKSGERKGRKPRLSAAERLRERQIRSSMGRRGFFKLIGVGTLGLGFGVSVFDTIFQYAQGAESGSKSGSTHMLFTAGTVDFMGFRAKEITPNKEFYITTYSDKVPEIDYDRHLLRIEGLVEKPYVLSIKDLEKMKDTKEFVTLQCIGNAVGGDAIGNALWEGVNLRKILDMAGPKAGIVKVALFAEDGYSDSIPYSLARSGDPFLAYRMNGEPLPSEHGYPLRVIVPGIYGMKNVKWLSKIELVNYDFKGFWEKRGWSDDAVMPIMSEILMPMDGGFIPPGNYMVGGIAFAGRYGISKVQVSFDKGQTWKDAHTKAPLSKWSWLLWEYDWKPTGEGKHTIEVRGIDRSGKVQESGSLLGRITGSFPDGSRGIHEAAVTVKQP
jgi:DMSO/TMAO reductase YedYZ molybdopterin-dependent catalytic subunit